MGGIVTNVPDDELVRLAREAALGRLTGGVVHALNNELFGMLANVELLLLDVPADGETHERLRLVQESGLGLRETLQRLGAVARDAGRTAPALEAETEELLEVVRRTARVGPVERSWPERPLATAAPGEVVATLVLHALLAGAAAAGRDGALAVAGAREGDTVVVRVRPGEAPPRLAAALAERHGGSFALEPDGALRLALPAA